MSLQIIDKAVTIHRVTLHDHCLMDNHYHRLIETQKENLSTFMRLINANYAKYFNRKYARSGHLWQYRYKKRVVKSDTNISMRRSRHLEEHFYDVQTKDDRDLTILNAYLDGHTQVDIAKCLDVFKFYPN